MSRRQNRYTQILERIFHSHFRPGQREVLFERSEIQIVAAELGIDLPKNLGDLVYSFRYRSPLPDSIKSCAPSGEEWIIEPAGPSLYRFVCSKMAVILPTPGLVETKVPDSTPGIISMYALGDEQALLAKLRYNRLIDIFTGVTCYSLQSHLRTAVPGLGQVETDELYVGLDRRGAHYVFPVQAKGKKDKINIVQIIRDYALCKAKFASLLCRPIAAQFMGEDLIALFAFERSDGSFAIAEEKHYRLVPPEEITSVDLETYGGRP